MTAPHDPEYMFAESARIVSLTVNGTPIPFEPVGVYAGDRISAHIASSSGRSPTLPGTAF